MEKREGLLARGKEESKRLKECLCACARRISTRSVDNERRCQWS
jgi:hypothetical protein